MCGEGRQYVVVVLPHCVSEARVGCSPVNKDVVGVFRLLEEEVRTDYWKT